MLYAVHWSFESDNRDTVNARFMETGGMPPEGVKMVGRWHSIEGGNGFCIAETDDPVALGKWVQNWSDLMDFTIDPVADDETITKILT